MVKLSNQPLAKDAAADLLSKFEEIINWFDEK
jgi:hypothetical protein